jgi:hypothetical protein
LLNNLQTRRFCTLLQHIADRKKIWYLSQLLYLVNRLYQLYSLAGPQVKLRETNQEMEKLVLERNSLLDTLNYLQEELFKSGKKN